MEFYVLLWLLFVGSASGLDFIEHGNLNDAKCANFTLSVDINTRAKLVDMIFKKNVEYIEVSVYIENELFDNFLQNSNITVNPTVAMPPYYKFVWVNQAGMNIHKMDYRFKMWSLGTLTASVKAIDFNILTNDTECFRKVNATDIFEKIENTFRRTLYYSGSSNAVDYSYLCHRYELYSDYENCLASHCFMFNGNNFQKTDGFCSSNVNRMINAQIWIWICLFFVFINNLPLLVFWLKQGPKTENKENGKKSGRNDKRSTYIPLKSDDENQLHEPETNRVRLFCVSHAIFEYYPSVRRWHNILFEGCFPKFIFVACFYVLFTLFYIWWFLITDLAYKTTEFRQRSKMSNGTDDYLVCFELLLAHVWNPGSIFFLFSLVYSSVGNMVLFCVIIWNSWWTQNDHFFLIGITCEDTNLQFNCLHRQMLLWNLSFWKIFWKRSILSDKWNICVRVLVAIPFIIPLTLIAVVCIMFPLVDIILHLPFRIFRDSGDKKDESNTCKLNFNTESFEFIDLSLNRFGIVCLLIFELPAFLYCITCCVSYIYPTALVGSMIASYTITGIMKNWDFLLPIFVLVGIVVSRFIKLIYGAFQPLHDLQVVIYKTYQKMSPEFKQVRAKFEQLVELKKYDNIRFRDVNEKLLGFPKLNSFIEQNNGNHYIRLPKIYEWMAVFPGLKDLLKFEDGHLFLSVEELIKLINVFGKLALKQEGYFYVSCQELINLPKSNESEKIFNSLIKKGIIAIQDKTHYIKIPLCSEELKLNYHSNNLQRKQPFIKHEERTGKYYIMVDNDNLSAEEKKELEKVSTIENTANVQWPQILVDYLYVECPRILVDYLHQVPLNDLIERKKNGDYYILESFLNEKCHPFLKHSRFSFYPFYAVVEFIGLCLFVALIGIGLYMLQNDSNFGKVFVAIFLTYIPKLLDTITKPWYSDVSKINMEDYVNEAMKEELKKRQNCLDIEVHFDSITVL